MKLSEMKYDDRNEQYRMILEHEQLKLIDAINDPTKVRGKVLCFIGNYAGFETRGLVVRKFIYNFEEKKWIISDKDMSDDFEEFYNKHFENYEMSSEFKDMFEQEGYLLNLD